MFTSNLRQYLLNNANRQLANQELMRRNFQRSKYDPTTGTSNADGSINGNIQIEMNAETELKSDLFYLLQPYVSDGTALQTLVDSISDDDANLLVLNFNTSVKSVLDGMDKQKWNIKRFKQRLEQIANELRTRTDLASKVGDLTAAITQRNAADHAKDTEIKLLKNRMSSEKAAAVPEKYRPMFDTLQKHEEVTPDLAPRKLDSEMQKVDPAEIQHMQREIKQLYQETKDLKYQKEIWLSATKSLRQVDKKIKSTKSFSETVLNNKLKEIGDDAGLLELYLVNVNRKIAERPERAEPHVEGVGLLRSHHHITGGGAYYIDRHKLGDNNMLVIRYTKNRHTIPIKPQYISSQLRDVIEYSLDHDGDVDRKAYHKLSDFEKNLFRVLTKYIDVDEIGSGLSDNRSWHDQWSVLKGEILSGNDSRVLKQQAREFLKHAVMIGRISRNDYAETLDELHL